MCEVKMNHSIAVNLYNQLYSKGVKNYSFSNYSKLAYLCKIIWVEGKLLEITEMEPNGGYI